MFTNINYRDNIIIRKDDNMALSDNIKNARKKKMLTQRELAEKLGVSHNTISDWERGYSKPDTDTVFLLCEILNVDANYLFDWKKDNTSDEKTILINALKKNNFLNDDDDLSDADLITLLNFIKNNKDFLIKKK